MRERRLSHPSPPSVDAELCFAFWNLLHHYCGPGLGLAPFHTRIFQFSRVKGTENLISPLRPPEPPPCALGDRISIAEDDLRHLVLQPPPPSQEL